MGGLLEGAVERLSDTYEYVWTVHTHHQKQCLHMYIYPFHKDLLTQVEPESNPAMQVQNPYHVHELNPDLTLVNTTFKFYCAVINLFSFLFTIILIVYMHIPDP